MAEDFIWAAKDGVYVKLRVSPGAKSTAIRGLCGEEALKLSVSAPPTKGKANAEVESFLAGLLGVPKGGVSVVKGGSSRDKARLGARIPAERDTGAPECPSLTQPTSRCQSC